VTKPAVLCGAILLALAASGQQAPGSRGGGLVPGGAPPKAGLTREELVRSWDLDGDGTISKSEADLARARMKRQRLEMQFGTGIDPVTGLPRGNVPSEDGEDVEEPLFQLPPELAPPTSRRRDDAALPGTRPPPPAVRDAPPPSGSAEAAGPTSEPRTTTAPPIRSGRASWLPPATRTPGPTGGVRAGAPAAVPGYGSGVWSDLNAGRPRPPPAGSSEPPGGRPAAGGGLLPSGRQPGRTGAIILPGQAPRPAAPRQPVAPAPTFPQPRITAEEIGGARP